MAADSFTSCMIPVETGTAPSGVCQNADTRHIAAATPKCLAAQDTHYAQTPKMPKMPKRSNAQDAQNAAPPLVFPKEYHSFAFPSTTKGLHFHYPIVKDKFPQVQSPINSNGSARCRLHKTMHKSPFPERFFSYSIACFIISDAAFSFRFDFNRKSRLDVDFPPKLNAASCPGRLAWQGAKSFVSAIRFHVTPAALSRFPAARAVSSPSHLAPLCPPVSCPMPGT